MDPEIMAMMNWTPRQQATMKGILDSAPPIEVSGVTPPTPYTERSQPQRFQPGYGQGERPNAVPYKYPEMPQDQKDFLSQQLRDMGKDSPTLWGDNGQHPTATPPPVQVPLPRERPVGPDLNPLLNPSNPMWNPNMGPPDMLYDHTQSQRMASNPFASLLGLFS